MKELYSLLSELKSQLPNCEILNVSVSKSSVGWHIEHTLMTMIIIIEALERSKPDEYTWKFNLTRTFIFAINKIPRGKAKAPRLVQPKGEILAENLEKKVNLANEKIKMLSNLHGNHFFEHPYFGKLNLKPTIRFLKLHTRHHLKIINDIVQA